MGACASKRKSVTALVPELCVEAGVESSVTASTSGTALEVHIERSRSHWSELAEPRERLSMEEAAAIKLDNEEVFKALESHPEWGYFFSGLDDFEELKVGEKFAEGAQAELFHVHIRWRNPKHNEEDMEKGRKWVVKVFKEGTSVRDLQRQWPHGLFQYRAKIDERYKLGKLPWNRFQSEVHCATLLEDGRFAFVMGKEDGDLRSLIDCRMMESGYGGCGPFLGVVATRFMCDVALGVDFLHRFNIVHRDLKASNVLVYTKPSGNTYCVVADYECSIGVVGTGYWRAPEILQACKERNVHERLELFSKAADIYSLGMIFYEILTGKHPFEDEHVTMHLVIKGQRPCVPAYVNGWTQQLLHWCWQSEPNSRPTIEDVLGILEANSSLEYIRHHIAKRMNFSEEEQTSANSNMGPTSN